jgi:3-phenylpropionate/trans-cinnamate dioxygenase ferredoxin subunit
MNQVMEYLFALKTSALPSGSMKMVMLADHEVLIANVKNQFYAISNICTHLKGSLVKGKLNGKFVTCPNHGAQFDVTTGKCTGQAKILFIKTTPADEKMFPVKVEGDNVLVGVEQT